MEAIKCSITGINPNGTISINDGTKTVNIARDKLSQKIKEHKIEVTNTIKVKCLQKQRDKHNNITAYLIQDKNGNKRVFAPKELKHAIYNFQIDCINLTLTSDGRLVDTTPDNIEKAPSNVVCNTTYQVPFKKIPCENKKQIITDYILTKDTFKQIYKSIIDDVKQFLNIEIPNESVTKEIMFDNIDINLCIVGRGANKDLASIKGIKKINNTNLGLLSQHNENENKYRATVFCMDTNGNLKLPSNCKRILTGAFESPYIATFILNGIDWSDVETTEEMFYGSYITRDVKILNSEAPKLKNMYGMYKYSEVRSIDMEKFIVPNLERTTSMFYRCIHLDDLNLSGLSFKNAKYVGMMFYESKLKEGKLRFIPEGVNNGIAMVKPVMEYKSEKIIQQIKDLGWQGYPDGRPDDFDTTLSKPIQYYADEIKRTQRKHNKRNAKRNIGIITPDDIETLKQIYNL